MASRRRATAAYDLEELRPGRFVLHNPAVAQVLRGEGERIGDRFELRSQRVEGLLARVRQRGFRVITIADQIAALPAPTLPALPSAPYLLQTGDRLSCVDVTQPSGWREVSSAADGRYALTLGSVVRRRKGFGPARYAVLEPAGPRAISLDEALLIGYAQAGLPAQLLRYDDTAWQLAPLALPEAYRTLLARWAEPTPAGGWHGAIDTLPLTRQLLDRLA